MGGSSPNSGGPTNPYSYEQQPQWQQGENFQDWGNQNQQVQQNDSNWMMWNLQNPQNANWSSMFPQMPQQAPAGPAPQPSQFNPLPNTNFTGTGFGHEPVEGGPFGTQTAPVPPQLSGSPTFTPGPDWASQHGIQGYPLGPGPGNFGFHEPVEGVNPQQGALTGVPGMTNTSQPNVTAGSTFQLPQLSGNFGVQAQQVNPFANAVANILQGNKGG